MQSLLTESEAGEVLSVLKGSLDKNFESVTLSFGLLFRSETDKFRACCGLVCALLKEAFLDGRQRLFALFALLELHRDRERRLHPFWDFLVSCGTLSQTPPEEVELIHLFLVQHRGTELLRKNVNDYAKSVYSMPSALRLSHANALLQLQRQMPQKDCGIGAIGLSGLHRIVMERMNDRQGAVPRTHQAEIFQVVAKHLTVSGFEPIFTRPMPPIAASFESECQWRQPQIRPSLMWDCGRKYPSQEALQRLRAFMDEAILSPLTPSQQELALQDLQKDPKLVFRCDLDPDALPALVEHAPPVAAEMLRHLLPSPMGSQYLTSLVSMSVSLHSMEVVNSLATSITLPEDFVQGYISNCISSCNAIEDRHMQSRLVRLFCVLLQSLIKTGIVDMTHMTHEVQAFCIDHSRIREAAGLFRLLKQMETVADDEGPSL